MNREKESKGNVFLLKTSVCLRFSLLLLFLSLNPLLAKAEIIGNMDLHLWFTIDRGTKTAMVGTDRIQDDNTAPMLQGVVYGEPGYDPTWQAPWRNLVIPSTISYNGEEYTVTKIAPRAFRRTIEFKTITLPPTIREIGAEAFYWCTYLESITMSDSLLAIGDYTFTLCYKLERIHLPPGIKSIGYRAFADCTALKEINIPGSCTSIGVDAFLGCKNLEKLTLEDGDEPLQLSWTKGISDFYFPTDTEGRDTWEHPRGQFSDGKISELYSGRDIILPEPQYDPFSNYKKLCLPFERCGEWNHYHDLYFFTDPRFILEFGDGLTEIPSYVYNGFILNDLVLPPKLKTIADNALGGAGNEELILPETLESIGNHAIGGCSNIKQLILPSSLKSIGNNAFGGCPKLEELIIPENPPVFGEDVFGNTFPNFVRSNSLIPATLANDIFEKSAIYVPAGTGKTYRQQWKGLIIDPSDEWVTVNVKKSGSLYSRLLAQDIQISDVCKLKLKGTLNDDDWAIVGSMNHLYDWDLSELNAEDLPNNLLDGNTNLIHIALPRTLTSIRDKLFVQCNHLIGSIDIPTNCHVGDSAFVGTRIDKLSISQSDKIGKYAFSTCPQIQEVHAEGEGVVIGYKAFTKTPIRKVILGSGVEVADSAFFNQNIAVGAAMVDTIYVKNGVKHIGNNNFGYAKKQVFQGNVGHIGFEAFSGADTIYVSDITTWCRLPFSDISNVTPHLYISNEEVKDVEIPAEITEIRKYLFYDCSSLTAVDLHDNITEVQDSAFMNCPQLADIRLPLTLKEIKNSVFSGCSNLEQISLPSNLISIGDSAFYKTALSSVLFPATMKTIGDYAFSGTNIVSVQMPKSLTDIGGGAFSNCTSLEEINLSPQTKHIGDDAFCNCTGLKEILLPNSLPEIEWGTFAGCTNLQEIKIPTSVSSIGGAAFENCSGLKSVIVQWDNPPTLEYSPFEGISPDCYLYTPIGTSTTYFKAGWDMFNYLKEAGLVNIVVNKGGKVTYNDEVVINRAKEFVYAPYKSFNVNITPDEGYYLKKVKLNNDRVENEVEDNVLFIEEPEENLTLSVVFADKSIEMGDVNGDGITNKTDAVSVVDYILKKDTETFYEWNADMNDDDVINVTDAIRIISKMLNK